MRTAKQQQHEFNQLWLQLTTKGFCIYILSRFTVESGWYETAGRGNTVLLLLFFSLELTIPAAKYSSSPKIIIYNKSNLTY